MRRRRDCALCRDSECKGGGNPHCRARSPRPSFLYGILDTYGSLRFVVTADDIGWHARHDEIAIRVPNLTVHEPIAWGHISFVIKRIEIAVDEWIEFGPAPNTPWAREAIKMYRLREREHVRRSLDLGSIAET